MNNKTVDQERAAIELQSLNENAQPSGLVARWHQMWDSLTYHLLKTDEPQVRQRHDRNGNVWWVVHDPVSGRSLDGATEKEVLIWLEQLRYR